MWKLLAAFAVFAAVALFAIFKAGDQVDMGGEKHGVELTHAAQDKAPAAAPAAAGAPAASPAGAAPSASAAKP